MYLALLLTTRNRNLLHICLGRIYKSPLRACAMHGIIDLAARAAGVALGAALKAPLHEGWPGAWMGAVSSILRRHALFAAAQSSTTSRLKAGGYS